MKSKKWLIPPLGILLAILFVSGGFAITQTLVSPSGSIATASVGTAQTTEVRPVVIQPVEMPKAEKPKVGPIPDDVFKDKQYLKLAEKAGWTGAKKMANGMNGLRNEMIARTQFRGYLLAHEMEIYDESHVQAYLQSKADECTQKNRGTVSTSGAFFINGPYCMVDWFPLAGRDNGGSCFVGSMTGSSITTCSPVRSEYTKPIPKFALEMMAEIKADYPNAEFDVSDIREYKDPFLRVRFPWGSEVIARWDEPSFVP